MCRKGAEQLGSKWIVTLLGWTVVFALLAPVAHTFWVSFSPDSLLTPPVGVWSIRWYRSFLSDSRWMAATARSIVIAAFAATGSLLVAFPVAVALHRVSAIDRRLLLPFLMLPALVPPAALGTGLLPLVHVTRLWGTNLSMVLIHVTLGLPIALLIIRTHLTRELLELESAAQGLGASPWNILRRVTLPLTAPGLVAAAVSIFVLSLNESLVSLFLATPNNETLPSVVWPQLRYAATPLIAVASCVTSTIGVLGTMLVSRLLRTRFFRSDVPVLRAGEINSNVS